MQSVFLKIDIFGKKPPAYNINGHHTINSITGGVMTILVLFLTLAYAGQKLDDLLARKEVTTTSILEESALELTETVKVNEMGFRVAFSVENYQTGEIINDPRYVKWIVRMYYKTDVDTYKEDILPVEVCTDEELSTWGDHSGNQEQYDLRLREGRLFCIDKNVWDDMYLGGFPSESEYYRFEIIVSPCNYVHGHLGHETLDDISTDCIPDFE